MTLYEVQNDLMEFQEMCSDPESEMDEQIMKDTMESLEGAYDFKMECWCKVIKNLEALATAIDNEIKRLQQRLTIVRNNITRMKSFMIDSLNATGKQEAGGVLKARIVKNGGKLPLIVDENAELPEKYQKVEIKPNNEAIREALDKGEELPFAHFGERGVHINIK